MAKKMRHLDLFSGIGGFALASDRVFGDVEHIFCDNDRFCQQVLHKHWPEAKIYGDIRTLTNTANAGIEKMRKRENQVFLLTGGFPCQPFSQAGQRKGTEDDRYLWPEMLRIIHEFKPTWVIAENVRGILTIDGGLVFEQVCLDLEGEGYDVQPIIIPAVAVNAPHRRDRVWFIANRKDIEQKRSKHGGDGSWEPEAQAGNGDSDAPDTTVERPYWERNWAEVATELCGMDDGLPAKLDGFECTKAQHRAHQLKAYGNSIVPQVAERIMRAIKNTLIPVE